MGKVQYQNPALPPMIDGEWRSPLCDDAGRLITTTDAGSGTTTTVEAVEAVAPWSGQLSIAATEVQLSSAPNYAVSAVAITIYNIGPDPVWIGPTGLTAGPAGDGYPIPANTDLALPTSDLTAWYAICDAAETARICVMGGV